MVSTLVSDSHTIRLHELEEERPQRLTRGDRRDRHPVVLLRIGST